MKAATVMCQQIFSILALVIFLQKIILKSASKSSFFALASRSGFGATISDAVVRSSVVFCNSVSADRIVMAVSRLLRAVAALVILLSFATNAATARSNLDTAITMRSAETELQNTTELRTTASEIVAPKLDLDARAKKRRF